jgi:hypothetical protein
MEGIQPDCSEQSVFANCNVLIITCMKLPYVEGESWFFGVELRVFATFEVIARVVLVKVIAVVVVRFFGDWQWQDQEKVSHVQRSAC